MFSLFAFRAISVFSLLVYNVCAIMVLSSTIYINLTDEILSPATKLMCEILLAIYSLGIITYFVAIAFIHLGKPIFQNILLSSLIIEENMFQSIIGSIIFVMNYHHMSETILSTLSPGTCIGFFQIMFLVRLGVFLIAYLVYLILYNGDKPLIVRAVIEPYIETKPYVKASFEEGPCLICLEEYEDNELVAKLQCGHYYHKDCLMIWNKTICPLCHQNIKEATNYHSIV